MLDPVCVLILSFLRYESYPSSYLAPQQQWQFRRLYSDRIRCRHGKVVRCDWFLDQRGISPLRDNLCIKRP
jgi:hypothetical protein